MKEGGSREMPALSSVFPFPFKYIPLIAGLPRDSLESSEQALHKAPREERKC